MTIVDFKPLQKKHGGQLLDLGGWLHNGNIFNAVGYCRALDCSVKEYIEQLDQGERPTATATKPAAKTAKPSTAATIPETSEANPESKKEKQERKGKGERVSGLMMHWLLCMETINITLQQTELED